MEVDYTKLFEEEEAEFAQEQASIETEESEDSSEKPVDTEVEPEKGDSEDMVDNTSEVEKEQIVEGTEVPGKDDEKLDEKEKKDTEEKKEKEAVAFDSNSIVDFADKVLNNEPTTEDTDTKVDKEENDTDNDFIISLTKGDVTLDNKDIMKYKDLSLKGKDYYWNNTKLKENFEKKYGAFAETKFNEFYEKVSEKYSNAVLASYVQGKEYEDILFKHRGYINDRTGGTYATKLAYEDLSSAQGQVKMPDGMLTKKLYTKRAYQLGRVVLDGKVIEVPEGKTIRDYLDNSKYTDVNGNEIIGWDYSKDPRGMTPVYEGESSAGKQLASIWDSSGYTDPELESNVWSSFPRAITSTMTGVAAGIVEIPNVLLGAALGDDAVNNTLYKGVEDAKTFLKRMNISNSDEALEKGLGSVEGAADMILSSVAQIALAQGLGAGLSFAGPKASNLGVRSILTLFGIGDFKDKAKLAGMSEREQALLWLGLGSVMWGVNSTFNWVENKTDAARTIKGYKTAMETYRSKMSALPGLGDKATAFKKGQMYWREFFKKLEGASGYLHGAVSETAEEITEFAGQEAFQSLYNVAKGLTGDYKLNKGRFYDARDKGYGAYFGSGVFQSGLGGLSGGLGGHATSQFISAASRKFKKIPKDNLDPITRAIASGGYDQLLKTANEFHKKKQWGPENISAERDVKTKSWKPMTDSNTQMSINDVIHNNFLSDIKGVLVAMTDVGAIGSYDSFKKSNKHFADFIENPAIGQEFNDNAAEYIKALDELTEDEADIVDKAVKDAIKTDPKDRLAKIEGLSETQRKVYDSKLFFSDVMTGEATSRMIKKALSFAPLERAIAQEKINIRTSMNFKDDDESLSTQTAINNEFNARLKSSTAANKAMIKLIKDYDIGVITTDEYETKKADLTDKLELAKRYYDAVAQNGRLEGTINKFGEDFYLQIDEAAQREMSANSFKNEDKQKAMKDTRDKLIPLNIDGLLKEIKENPSMMMDTDTYNDLIQSIIDKVNDKTVQDDLKTNIEDYLNIITEKDVPQELSVDDTVIQKAVNLLITDRNAGPMVKPILKEYMALTGRDLNPSKAKRDPDFQEYMYHSLKSLSAKYALEIMKKQIRENVAQATDLNSILSMKMKDISEGFMGLFDANEFGDLYDGGDVNAPFEIFISGLLTNDSTNELRANPMAVVADRDLKGLPENKTAFGDVPELYSLLGKNMKVVQDAYSASKWMSENHAAITSRAETLKFNLRDSANTYTKDKDGRMVKDTSLVDAIDTLITAAEPSGDMASNYGRDEAEIALMNDLEANLDINEGYINSLTVYSDKVFNAKNSYVADMKGDPSALDINHPTMLMSSNFSKEFYDIDVVKEALKKDEANRTKDENEEVAKYEEMLGQIAEVNTVIQRGRDALESIRAKAKEEADYNPFKPSFVKRIVLESKLMSDIYTELSNNTLDDLGISQAEADELLNDFKNIKTKEGEESPIKVLDSATFGGYLHMKMPDADISKYGLEIIKLKSAIFNMESKGVFEKVIKYRHANSKDFKDIADGDSRGLLSSMLVTTNFDVNNFYLQYKAMLGDSDDTSFVNYVGTSDQTIAALTICAHMNTNVAESIDNGTSEFSDLLTFIKGVYGSGKTTASLGYGLKAGQDLQEKQFYKDNFPEAEKKNKAMMVGNHPQHKINLHKVAEEFDIKVHDNKDITDWRSLAKALQEDNTILDEISTLVIDEITLVPFESLNSVANIEQDALSIIIHEVNNYNKTHRTNNFHPKVKIVTMGDPDQNSNEVGTLTKMNVLTPYTINTSVRSFCSEIRTAANFFKSNKIVHRAQISKLQTAFGPLDPGITDKGVVEGGTLITSTDKIAKDKDLLDTINNYVKLKDAQSDVKDPAKVYIISDKENTDILGPDSELKKLLDSHINAGNPNIDVQIISHDDAQGLEADFVIIDMDEANFGILGEASSTKDENGNIKLNSVEKGVAGKKLSTSISRAKYGAIIIDNNGVIKQDTNRGKIIKQHSQKFVESINEFKPIVREMLKGLEGNVEIKAKDVDPNSSLKTDLFYTDQPTHSNDVAEENRDFIRENDLNMNQAVDKVLNNFEPEDINKTIEEIKDLIHEYEIGNEGIDPEVAKELITVKIMQMQDSVMSKDEANILVGATESLSSDDRQKYAKLLDSRGVLIAYTDNSNVQTMVDPTMLGGELLDLKHSNPDMRAKAWRELKSIFSLDTVGEKINTKNHTFYFHGYINPDGKRKVSILATNKNNETLVIGSINNYKNKIDGSNLEIFEDMFKGLKDSGKSRTFKINNPSRMLFNKTKGALDKTSKSVKGMNEFKTQMHDKYGDEIRFSDTVFTMMNKKHSKSGQPFMLYTFDNKVDINDKAFFSNIGVFEDSNSVLVPDSKKVDRLLRNGVGIIYLNSRAQNQQEVYEMWKNSTGTALSGFSRIVMSKANKQAAVISLTHVGSALRAETQVLPHSAKGTNVHNESKNILSDGDLKDVIDEINNNKIEAERVPDDQKTTEHLASEAFASLLDTLTRSEALGTHSKDGKNYEYDVDDKPKIMGVKRGIYKGQNYRNPFGYIRSVNPISEHAQKVNYYFDQAALFKSIESYLTDVKGMEEGGDNFKEVVKAIIGKFDNVMGKCEALQDGVYAAPIVEHNSNGLIASPILDFENMGSILTTSVDDIKTPSLLISNVSGATAEAFRTSEEVVDDSKLVHATSVKKAPKVTADQTKAFKQTVENDFFENNKARFEGAPLESAGIVGLISDSLRAYFSNRMKSEGVQYNLANLMDVAGMLQRFRDYKSGKTFPDYTHITDSEMTVITSEVDKLRTNWQYTEDMLENIKIPDVLRDSSIRLKEINDEILTSFDASKINKLLFETLEVAKSATNISKDDVLEIFKYAATVGAVVNSIEAALTNESIGVFNYMKDRSKRFKLNKGEKFDTNLLINENLTAFKTAIEGDPFRLFMKVMHSSLDPKVKDEVGKRILGLEVAPRQFIDTLNIIEQEMDDIQDNVKDIKANNVFSNIRKLFPGDIDVPFINRLLYNMNSSVINSIDLQKEFKGLVGASKYSDAELYHMYKLCQRYQDEAPARLSTDPEKVIRSLRTGLGGDIEAFVSMYGKGFSEQSIRNVIGVLTRGTTDDKALVILYHAATAIFNKDKAQLKAVREAILRHVNLDASSATVGDLSKNNLKLIKLLGVKPTQSELLTNLELDINAPESSDNIHEDIKELLKHLKGVKNLLHSNTNTITTHKAKKKVMDNIKKAIDNLNSVVESKVFEKYPKLEKYHVDMIAELQTKYKEVENIKIEEKGETKVDVSMYSYKNMLQGVNGITDETLEKIQNLPKEMITEESFKEVVHLIQNTTTNIDDLMDPSNEKGLAIRTITNVPLLMGKGFTMAELKSISKKINEINNKRCDA